MDLLYFSFVYWHPVLSNHPRLLQNSLNTPSYILIPYIMKLENFKGLLRLPPQPTLSPKWILKKIFLFSSYSCRNSIMKMSTKGCIMELFQAQVVSSTAVSRKSFALGILSLGHIEFKSSRRPMHNLYSLSWNITFRILRPSLHTFVHTPLPEAIWS